MLAGGLARTGSVRLQVCGSLSPSRQNLVGIIITIIISSSIRYVHYTSNL